MWGAVALVAGEIISFVTFLVGQALIHGKAPSTTLGGHDVLRAVVGAGLYLAVLGVLGSGLGVLLRHAAAAIGSIVAILLVLPGIAAALSFVMVEAHRAVVADQRRTAGGHRRS